jgi:hypothetical protein
MSQATKFALKLSLILLTTLLLTSPALAQRESGRTIVASTSGAMTVRQADGSTQTIDLEGTLRAGLYRGRIVIDHPSAGLIQETGERVTIDSTQAGTYQREGSDLRISTIGQLALEQADGSRIVIDVISAGVIQQRGRSIVIDIIHAGIVQESGSRVTIHSSYAGEVGDGTDI